MFTLGSEEAVQTTMRRSNRATHFERGQLRPNRTFSQTKTFWYTVILSVPYLECDISPSECFDCSSHSGNTSSEVNPIADR